MPVPNSQTLVSHIILEICDHAVMWRPKNSHTNAVFTYFYYYFILFYLRHIFK